MIKKSAFLLLPSIVFIGMFLTNGCYYDNEEELYPSGCDTTGVQYSDVLVTLENNCYGCHGNGQKQGGIDLGRYDALKEHVDNGKFLCAVSRSGSCAPMPPTGPPISDCQLSQIREWINDGAPR